MATGAKSRQTFKTQECANTWLLLSTVGVDVITINNLQMSRVACFFVCQNDIRCFGSDFFQDRQCGDRCARFENVGPQQPLFAPLTT